MGRATLAAGVVLAALGALFGMRAHHQRLPQPAQVEAVTARGSAAPAQRAVARTETWCGTPSATDRPPAVTGYTVRVYYVLPLDGADHADTAAPQIAAYADAIDAWWGREDSSRRPRFDRYAAPCGPQLDINTFRSSQVSVGNTDGLAVFGLLWNEFRTRPEARYTKYLVFLDDVDPRTVCGLASPALGSAIGKPSMGLAVVFMQACNGTDLASTATHELLHAISPVGGLPGAPHTCPNDTHHVCDSSGDILYPRAEYGIPIMSLELDVNHDDYYAATAPTNLQVQPWLRRVQEQSRLALAITGQGSVTSDVPGVDCAATCSTDWDTGTQFALTATPADGSRFVGWGGACKDSGDESGCAVTMSAATDVSAIFAPESFPLAVTVKGNGTVTSSPRGIGCKRATCKASFTSFTPVLLTAKPAKGWRFAGWAGACRGPKASCRVPMSAPTVARATFAKTR